MFMALLSYPKETENILILKKKSLIEKSSPSRNKINVMGEQSLSQT